MTDDPRSEAARRLRELAIEFTERSHRAQSDLIRSFEAAAAALSPQVGDVVVEQGDDEALALGADGRFRGSLLDRQTAEWRAIESPDDVVDFYDPVDLFDDLAGAIEEAVPGLADDDGDAVGSAPLDAASPPASGRAPGIDPWLARIPRAEPAQDGAPVESASMTILKDLHAAGVFSDEEFAARKAKLEQS